jgi:hypothetical protein
VPLQEPYALLRDAQRATDCVLVGPNSAAIRTSSALPVIPLDAARDGQRFLDGH